PANRRGVDGVRPIPSPPTIQGKENLIVLFNFVSRSSQRRKRGERLNGGYRASLRAPKTKTANRCRFAELGCKTLVRPGQKARALAMQVFLEVVEDADGGLGRVEEVVSSGAEEGVAIIEIAETEDF